MQRGSILNYILVILLVFILMGYISLGDVLSFIGYIIMGILLLVIAVALVLRIRLSSLRRRMEEEGGRQGSARTYTWNFGGRQQQGDNRREGDVTVDRKSGSGKRRVNRNIGDYVDYEDVDKNTDRE